MAINTLRVWGRRNSLNVQKVMWCVAELGLAHERMEAGLQHGRNREEWYLAMNPNGLVPLIEDGSFSLWESNAIVRYLCAKHDYGGLCPESVRDRADAERWMDWQLSRLARPVNIVFWDLIRAPEGERDVRRVERYVRESNEMLGLLERHLEGREYVALDRFTMADIPVGATAHRWLALPGVERPAFPALERWYRRLTERPAYREHVMLPLS
jgi:glutathione S-transferase